MTYSFISKSLCFLFLNYCIGSDMTHGFLNLVSVRLSVVDTFSVYFLARKELLSKKIDFIKCF